MIECKFIIIICACLSGQNDPVIKPRPDKSRDPVAIAATLKAEASRIGLATVLSGSMQASNLVVRRAVFKQIVRLSNDSRAQVENLVFLLRSPDAAGQDEAIEALKKMSRATSTIFPGLIEAAGDEDPGVRADAGLAMDTIYSVSKDLLNELILISRLRDKRARKVALEAMAIMSEDVKDATASLIKALLSKDRRKRLAVVKNGMIVSNRAGDSLAVITDALNDEDESIRKLASGVLASMTIAARISTPGITLAINDPDAEVRAAATATWRDMLPSLVVPSLLDSKKNPDSHIRQRIVDALGDGGIASQEAVPTIIRVLRVDVDPDVRSSAALALGSIGRPSDVIARALRGALADDDAQVRATAFYVLRLFDPEVQSALSHAVRREIDRTPFSEAASHLSQLLFFGIIASGICLLLLGLGIGTRKIPVVMAAAGFLKFLGNSSQRGGEISDRPGDDDVPYYSQR